MGEEKTHILVECPLLIASANLGVLRPLKPMETSGKCEVIFCETRKIKRQHLQWCDIFVCVRGCENVTLKIVQEMKRLGRLVIYYLDDDLMNLPKDSLSYSYYTSPNIKQNIFAILSLTDVLWGVNDKIRERYLNLTNGKEWISNRLPIEVTNIKCKTNRRVCVLYAGSVDHKPIIKEILVPAVKTLATRYEKTVDFVFVGPDPELQNFNNVYHYPFFEDYKAYRDFVQTGFDIGLAPTRTGEFYQCKYYNKFVEYASIGAVGIYTDCFLYQQIVKHNQNGVLCKNTIEDWTNAIEQLILNFELREKCSKNAKLLLEQEFTSEKVAEALEAQCPVLISFRAPAVKLSEIYLVHALIGFYLDRMDILWKRYSILAIPLIVYKAVIKIYKMVVKGIKRLVSRLF